MIVSTTPPVVTVKSANRFTSIGPGLEPLLLTLINALVSQIFFITFFGYVLRLSIKFVTFLSENLLFTEMNELFYEKRVNMG